MERQPLRAKAQPGESRARQAFFFKSHLAKPLYGKRHPAWTWTFKQEVTSLTDLASMEPAGFGLDLEPVLYSLPPLSLLLLPAGPVSPEPLPCLRQRGWASLSAWPPGLGQQCHS